MLRSLSRLIRAGFSDTKRRKRITKQLWSTQPLEQRALLTDVLRVSAQAEPLNVTPGSQFTVTVALDFEAGSDGGFDRDGIAAFGLRTHLDTNKVTFVSASVRLNGGEPPTEIRPDTANADNDSTTNHFLSYNWATESEAKLNQRALLFDLTLRTADTFAGQSSINFSQIAGLYRTDGYEFASTPLILRGPNRAPSLDAIPASRTNEDQQSDAITLVASDPDGDQLTYSFSTSDTTLIPQSGFSFNSATKELRITPAQNRSGVATVTARVSDGTTQTIRIFQFTVDPVNDPPVASSRTVTTNLNTAIEIPALTYVTDVDGAPAAPPFTVTVVSPSLNGTTQERPNGSILFTPADGFEGTTTFQYRANDGTADSAPATITVNVVRNQPPVITGLQDLNLNIRSEILLPVQISDPENNTLTVTTTAASTAVVSSLQLEGTGVQRQLRLRTGGTVGRTRVTVSVSDGVNQPVISEFDVTTTAFIDAGARTPVPGAITHVGVANAVAVPFSTSATISLASLPAGTAAVPAALFQTGVYDNPGGAELQFSMGTIPGEAYTVELFFAETWSGGFAPGRRVFDVAVEGSIVLNDFDIFAAAGANTAAVRSFEVIGDGTLSIDLTRVVQNPIISGIRVQRLAAPNTPPSISAIGNQQTSEDSAINGIEFSVTDAENQPLTVTVSSADTSLIPNAGLVLSGTGNNRQLSITPAPNRFGTTTVTVSVSDGRSTSTRTFPVVVSAVNDAPVAVADSATTRPDTAVTISVLSNDSDIDGSLNPASVLITQPSGNGTAVANANGTVTFTPAAGYTGEASFRYTVRDSDGAESNSALVTVDVVANSSPVISSIADLQLNAGAVSAPIAVQISDSDGDSLTINATAADTSIVRSAVITGTGINRQLVITAGNKVGQTTVTLSVTDGINTPVTRTFNVTVGLFIDAGASRPSAGTVSHAGFTSGSAASFSSSAAIAGAPAGVPTTLFNSLLFGSSAGAPLKFSVPTLPGAALSVDLFFAETWSGAFGAGRRVFDVALEGAVVLNDLDIFAQVGANRALVRSFDVTSDGTLNIDLTHGIQNPVISGIRVRPQTAPNAPPVISTIENQTTSEDIAINNIPFTVTDPDPAQTLTVTVVSSNTTLLPVAGLTLSGTGSNRSLSVAPAQNQSGTGNVTVTVSDGRATSSTTFAVAVAPVNDAPTAAADSASTSPATAVTIPVLGNDSDSDGSLVNGSIVIVEQSPNGTAVPNANGTVTFTPNAGFTGNASFRYSVRDNDGADSNTATVTVSVVANSAPVISAIADLELNLGTASTPIAFQVSDADGDSLNISASAADSTIVSSVAIRGTGNNRQLVVTAGNTVGETTVTVSVADGTNAPVTRTFSVIVFALIDAGTTSPVPGTLADRAFQNGVGRNYSGAAVTVAPGSLAASVPAQLFRTVVWDDVGGNELAFDIRAKAGQRYTVDLFFAELWNGAFANGRRVFDVVLDGQTVLDDFDVFREAGGGNIGIARRFELESDGIIDLDLLHGIQNPTLAGIRVTPIRQPN